MKELGIKLPYTTWNLYRDVFIHNDEFVVAAVGEMALQSSIYLTTVDEDVIGDFLAKDGRNVDPSRLQRQLTKYLEDKIQSTNDLDEVEIIVAIEYDPNSSNPEVKEAIREIRDFYSNLGNHES